MDDPTLLVQYPAQGDIRGIWQPDNYRTSSLMRFGAVTLKPRMNEVLGSVPFWRVHWYDEMLQVRAENERRWSTVAPGQIAVQAPWSVAYRKIKKHTPHRYAALLIPSIDRFNALRLKPSLIVFKATSDQDSRQFATRLLSEGSQDVADRLKLLSITTACIAAYFARVTTGNETTHDLQKDQMPTEIKQAKFLIENEMAMQLPVSRIAKAAGCSPSHLNRLFRLYFNTSITKYVMNRRIYRAAELLSCSNQSIDQIADTCGFCSRYYFTKVFSREFGIAPATFRRNSKV